eukprot:TRINITY_DN2236_c0_g1_i3.p1 TRINITY_DN2236_c0_g1~~TRINITY_DN2236_c0_g1_i3.p1  ORF type:complete len:547 (+),score=80.81 TRINITY_DN2236_c0_g1_i3:103-1743(+)
MAAPTQRQQQGWGGWTELPEPTSAPKVATLLDIPGASTVPSPFAPVGLGLMAAPLVGLAAPPRTPSAVMMPTTLVDLGGVAPAVATLVELPPAATPTAVLLDIPPSPLPPARGCSPPAVSLKSASARSLPSPLASPPASRAASCSPSAASASPQARGSPATAHCAEEVAGSDSDEGDLDWDALGDEIPSTEKLISEDDKLNPLVSIIITGVVTALSAARPMTADDVGKQFRYTFKKEIDSSCTCFYAKHDFEFVDYSPVVFRALRNVAGIDNVSYKDSFVGSHLYELRATGKSGSFFYGTSDMKYIIKTVTKPEQQLLISILGDYYQYMKTHQDTLLVRFFGLHNVVLADGQAVAFVIMENIFPNVAVRHTRYDIKGSTQGRFASEAERNNTNAVFKDLDLLKDHNRGIILGPTKRCNLIRTVISDANVRHLLLCSAVAATITINFQSELITYLFTSSCPRETSWTTLYWLAYRVMPTHQPSRRPPQTRRQRLTRVLPEAVALCLCSGRTTVAIRLLTRVTGRRRVARCTISASSTSSRSTMRGRR